MSENRRPVQHKTVSRSAGTASQSVRSASQASRSRAAAARRRKKQQQKQLTMLLIAAAAVLAIVVLLVVINPFKKPAAVSGGNTPQNTAPVQQGGESQGSLFSDLVTEERNDGLNAAEAGSINVEDLRITAGLDEKWENILLMGTDSRVLSEPCRTDTMMICSINKTTGEIKLTTLMRDSEVKIDGKSRRLNSAYFFGGAKLAMRTVNESFGMNITKYVIVDFSAFATIAEKVGGVEIDVTKNEAGEINHNVAEQYKLLVKQGKMAYEDAEKAFYACLLEGGGSQLHLNGMQTLGYARIRKLDSDFARAERQRKVLNLLMLKIKDKSTVELMDLLMDSMGIMKTNLDMNTIMTLGQKVISREGFNGASTYVIPVQGTYKEEKRNDDAMLWDIDFEANKRELHAFIYLR